MILLKDYVSQYVFVDLTHTPIINKNQLSN